VIGTLQRLGARWTGVAGCPECSGMRWTGFVPHIPFTVDARAALQFRDLALKARDALATVPRDAVDDTRPACSTCAGKRRRWRR